MGSQGRSRKGPEHIGTVLDSLFKQQGIEESIRVHRAVVDWDSVVGDADREARKRRPHRAWHIDRRGGKPGLDAPAPDGGIGTANPDQPTFR